MEEYRTARKHIEKLNDVELKELLKMAEKETGAEGKVIFFLLLSELERRKVKDLYLKGMITKEEYEKFNHKV